MQYAALTSRNTSFPLCETFSFPTILNVLSKGKDLSAPMAETLFFQLMAGNLLPEQIGAALLSLRCKGETALEIAAAAKAVLDHAIMPHVSYKNVIDVVGTGGDGKSSFNCSTATALTLAGMGVKVVKHGNRSVTSKCGSADALEKLAIPFASPDAIDKELAARNFAFLFAPDYHPAFRHIMPIRRRLGVRTLFNFLGPLVNPALPKYRLIGVATKDLLPLMAGALARLDIRSASVVYGAGGYDELTPMGPSLVYLVQKQKIEHFILDPEAYGFSPCGCEDVAIHDANEGEEVLRAVLRGNGPHAMQEMVALNVGLALFTMRGGSLFECMESAKIAVNAGVGGRVLDA